jgi:hypothetical protein
MHIRAMVFDLGKAMSRKEEWESARLLDFEFRRRARATRMAAQSLGIDETDAARIAATTDDQTIPERLATLSGAPIADVAATYQRCLSTVHSELVAERGDLTPFRLG